VDKQNPVPAAVPHPPDAQLTSAGTVQPTMSVCRPARCLFTKAASTTLPKAAPQRCFQTSASRQARKRRPNYPSIKAEDLKLLNQAAEAEYPKYDTTEETLLAKKYTPSQIAAIKAAESAIDTRDFVTQGQRRTDTWRLSYEDDLAEVDPITDKRIRLGPDDVKGRLELRMANPVERNEAIAMVANQTLAKMYPDGIPEGKRTPEQEKQLEEAYEAALSQAALDPRATFTADSQGTLEALADPRHSLVGPSLPRIDTRMVRQTRRLSNEEEEDPRQKRLLQYLGWDKKKLRSIRTKTLVQHGVTNQTRMGKIRSLYYLTIAGNQDGLLGVGEGKSVEPEEGRKQSIMAAIRNMRPVPRYENRTTFGNLEMKVGATTVQLFARPPGKSTHSSILENVANISEGFGLRTQHLIFELARAAGLQDLAARTPRSRNKMNVIKATWEALTTQKLPDEIARARGKKMVDVRKVYYGGSVH
jgi:small subunit ribosomal protein S5